MQPYQQAADVTRRSGEMPLNALKYAGAAALGTAGSVAARSVISRMVPLLSSFIPQSFAKKALSKIDPRLGKFIDKAEDEGFDFNEVKNFFTSKIEKTEQQKNAQSNRNIIEQYSPELHQFILGEIQEGRSPLEAGALATLNRKGSQNFKSVIDKLTKEHKAPWSAILETVYGGQQGAQTSPDMQQQMQQQQQQPSQGSQGGPGQQALMDILGKINQRLGQ